MTLIQNRLEYTVKVDDNTSENLQSAESRIRDTDMADEMTRFSKESILQQAATSMLAQAEDELILLFLLFPFATSPFSCMIEID